MSSTPGSGSWLERAYRWALRLYPRSFRDEYEDEMLEWFGARLRDAEASGGRAARIRVWIDLTKDLVRSLPAEHLRALHARSAERPSGRSVVESFLRDVRLTLRSFVREPGFVFVASGTLAVGVAATTTIFSIVDGVLLRPLPFPDAHEMVRVGQVNPDLVVADGSFDDSERIFLMAYLDFLDLHERNRSFSHLAITRGARVTVVGDGDPEAFSGSYVSSDFFGAVGVQPAMGRAFTAEEEARGDRVVVLSDGIWQRRWGGDPDLIGTAITLDGRPHTVIGVMPSGFRGPEALGLARRELWLPAQLMEEASQDLRDAMANRRDGFLAGVARLRDGVSVEMARRELDRLGAQLREENPESSGDRAWGLARLHAQTVGSASTQILPLLGAVVLLLLIACANVANLLVVRAGDRAKEFAVRAAIGAGRGQIVRQLFTEHLILGLVAAAAGIGLSWFGVNAFVSLNPGTLPRLSEVSLDGRLLAFAVGLAVATSLIFGLAPALATKRLDVTAQLKDGSAGSGASPRVLRMRNSLVVSETALAFVLVVGAGLLINSFVRLNRIDPGFDPTGVHAMRVALPGAPSDQELVTFFDDVLERVAAIPGVESVGATAILPVSGGRMYQSLTFAGIPQPNDERYSVRYQEVAADYFQTVGIPLVSGRFFEAYDRPGGPLVALVNEAMAREAFGDIDPIGQRFSLGEQGRAEGLFEIVGVVADARVQSLAESPAPEIYFSHSQVPRTSLEIVAKSATVGTATLRAMQEQVWDVRADLPILRPVVLSEYLSGSIADSRFYTALLGGFAAIALALALVGIYANLAYTVALRAREMSIRMAIGANQRQVLGMVLGRGMLLISVGVAIGLAVALLGTRVLSSFVYDVTTTDPFTLAGGAVAVFVTALLASWIPARRATLMEPVEALRSE